MLDKTYETLEKLASCKGILQYSSYLVHKLIWPGNEFELT